MFKQLKNNYHQLNPYCGYRKGPFKDNGPFKDKYTTFLDRVELEKGKGGTGGETIKDSVLEGTS